MNNNFIGQEVTIECNEGFEFIDPVEAYNHTEPETSTLGNIQFTQKRNPSDDFGLLDYLF